MPCTDQRNQGLIDNVLLANHCFADFGTQRVEYARRLVKPVTVNAVSSGSGNRCIGGDIGVFRVSFRRSGFGGRVRRYRLAAGIADAIRAVVIDGLFNRLQCADHIGKIALISDWRAQRTRDT
jgi:hypothetical protein